MKERITQNFWNTAEASKKIIQMKNQKFGLLKDISVKTFKKHCCLSLKVLRNRLNWNSMFLFKKHILLQGILLVLIKNMCHVANFHIQLLKQIKEIWGVYIHFITVDYLWVFHCLNNNKLRVVWNGLNVWNGIMCKVSSYKPYNTTTSK